MRRLASFVLLLLSPSCGSTPPGPYTPMEEASREPRKAERLNQEAAQKIESDPVEAERLLRDALTADVFHGPAHNNLGVLYLSQSRFYEAANEFEWARKLMPGHPDPRLNLGIALERAGRVEAAMESYESALEVYPGHIPTYQAMARLMLRAGREDGRLSSFLEDIALRGETEEWREWAQRQRVGRGE